MKVLFNKLKKSNKIFLVIYLITFIIYLITYILLIKNLMSLSGIETAIRIIVIIWYLVTCLFPMELNKSNIKKTYKNSNYYSNYNYSSNYIQFCKLLY